MAATISGSGTSTLIDLTTSGNTILGDASTDTLNVGNGGLVKDASGNVGIGTSSPAYKLDVQGSVGATIASKTAEFNAAGGSIYSSLNDGTKTWRVGVGIQTAGMFTFRNHTDGTVPVNIDSSGNLLVGTTSALGKFTVTGAVSSTFIPSDGNGITFTRNSTNYIQANGGSSATIQVISNTGGVQLSNGATSWTAVSDETQKDIIELIENAISKVSTLRAVIGKYKTDESDKRRSFLIAQDVQAVLPEAVNVIAQENGSEVLGLAYTDVIPLLVAAIKEQQALITQLQADVAALKGTA